MNPQDIMQKMQTIANDMQNKVGDAIRQSPAKDLEKNVRGLMTQGFQKLDLVTREEFDLQTQVLARTRAKLEELEAKINRTRKQKIISSFPIKSRVQLCFFIFYYLPLV